MKPKTELQNESRTQFANFIAIQSGLVWLCLAAASSPAQTYTVLHSFTGNDGANPAGDLILSGTTLYGTTSSGGNANYGTVFKVNTDGSGYAVLHSFTGADGSGPRAALVLSGITLYGTTPNTSNGFGGTLFKLNVDGGDFTVLKQYSGGGGAVPVGGLVLSGTTLYGTTEFSSVVTGGAGGYGTVFKVNTDGSGYTVLWNFSGNDLSGPYATLLLDGTTLYGTTPGGVFKIDTDGSDFTVLHYFTGGAAGRGAMASLTLSGTTLYGTTSSGGAGIFNGTVFKINTDGSGFSLLRSFYGNTGADLRSGLVLSGTTLYGTTVHDDFSPLLLYVGNGKLFKLNTDGNGYAVLHSFIGSDGRNPYSALSLSSSTLYGTTAYGGTLDRGVLFSLSVAPPTIVTSPQSQTAESGRTVNFTARTVGDPVLTYMWYFNVTNLVSYSTNGSLELSNVQLSQSGAYIVVVTNLFGAATSSPAMLNVIAVPPIILRPPVVETVERGTDVDLSLKVDGSLPLSFQWQFAGTNLINDTTNPDLLLTNVQLSQSGSYVVVVSNFFGSVTSAPTMLNVIPAVERKSVPGVKLTGETGSLLNVTYANFLSPAPNWTALGSVSLTSTSQFYFDLTTPLPPQRFYRAWQMGTPDVVPSLGLTFVPAITLTGNVGDSLRLDYINAIGPTDAWVTLDTVTLTNTSQLYFDVSSIGQPRRLYRIVPIP